MILSTLYFKNNGTIVHQGHAGSLASTASSKSLRIVLFGVIDLELVTLSKWYSLGLRILCSWRISPSSHPGNLVSNPWNLADLLRLYKVKVI